MRITKTLKMAILLGFLIFSLLFTSGLLFFGSIFLFFGNATTWAASESNTIQTDPNAFVYILNIGIAQNACQYNGLRNGFAVGNGQYVLTAAHCVDDYKNSNQTLLQPMVISPYYGDVFEAEIVAVDKKNDIAILKPTWDTHPALELETSEEWKKSKTIAIMGYPPVDKKRGGNGKNNSKEIDLEEVPLVSSNRHVEKTISVGPVEQVGKGWSGSALITPETGRVAGITCIKWQGKKALVFKVLFKLKIPLPQKWYISGCDSKAINSLFEKNHLLYGRSETSFPDLKHRHRFERILSTLDTLKPENVDEIQVALKDLYEQMPDSYFSNIIARLIIEKKLHFDNVLELAPESTFVRAAYGHNLLSQEDPQKAAEQFQIITERDPNHIFAYHGQLSALVKTDPNAAEILGKELTRRWPENADFCFEYSKALRAKNKRQEELPVIQKAIELCDEDDVPFQYQRYLADSLKANKHYEKSEQAYKKLLKTHECNRCWWAYTLLLLDMGPDKIEQAKTARDKTMTFIQDPNEVSEKQRFYEAALEKILSDPNEMSAPNH